jgi:hypothetical protein
MFHNDECGSNDPDTGYCSDCDYEFSSTAITPILIDGLYDLAPNYEPLQTINGLEYYEDAPN